MEMIRFSVGSPAAMKVHRAPAVRCNMALSVTKTKPSEVFKPGTVRWEKRQGDVCFPKVFLPKNDKQCSSLESVVKSVKENKEYLEDELKKHGALFFRGFPLNDGKDFDAFISAFGWTEMPFVGRPVRNHVAGKVWTANEGNLQDTIYFHHEMTWAKSYPTKISFFCEMPAQGRGETSILQSDRVAARMKKKFPEFYEELKQKRMVNIHDLRNGGKEGCIMGKSWQQYLGTEDKEEADKNAEAQGWKLKWKEGGDCVMTKSIEKGIIEYEGKEVWFNHIPFAMTGAMKDVSVMTLGDGTEIPDEVVNGCRDIMEEECVDLKWNKGDVVLLNNLTAQHCRRPSLPQDPSLPPRRVLVAMFE